MWQNNYQNYPLSYGQPKYEFLQYFLLWAGLSDDVDMGVASIVIVWF